MLRLNVILALVLVAVSLSVITARHQARKLFVDLERAQKRAGELDIEWERMQLEQSTWAMHARIEQVARSQLGMDVPDLPHIRVLAPAGQRP